MSRRMAATLLGFAASMGGAYALDGEPDFIDIGVRFADLSPVAKAEAKRAKRRARNLALRDAAIARGLRRAAREGRLVVVYETPTIAEVPA